MKEIQKNCICHHWGQTLYWHMWHICALWYPASCPPYITLIRQCWFCTSLYMFCFAEAGSRGEPVCLHLHSGPSNLDQPAVLGSHFLQRGPEPDPSPLSKHPRGESRHHCQVKGKTENRNKYHVANEKWGLGAFAQNEVLSCRKLWEAFLVFSDRHNFFLPFFKIV